MVRMDFSSKEWRYLQLGKIKEEMHSWLERLSDYFSASTTDTSNFNIKSIIIFDAPIISGVISFII